jgi:hypothetical protein
MTPSIVERSCPPSCINWLSHTAYSSAVRRGSVAIRQRATISLPRSVWLTSANTTLVLPASMASSMGPSTFPFASGIGQTSGDGDWRHHSRKTSAA